MTTDADHGGSQPIELSKPESAVSLGTKRVRMNLGWDPANGAESQIFDLDLSCLLLDRERRMKSGADLVYYGQRFTKDGCVVHSTDDPSGQRSDGGPDEWIDLDLLYLHKSVVEVLFAVTIYDHGGTPVFLSDIENVFVEAKNDVSHARIHHKRIEGAEYVGKKALEVGSLVRMGQGSEWEFKLSGKTYDQGLEALIGTYSDLGYAFRPVKTAPVIDLNATNIRRSTPPAS
ncbi:MAG: TerD family protein [Verrucomicrobiota bacterium]